MPVEFTIEKTALLVGLSFFIGLAFEGFYLKTRSSRPGGIRTFPLLAFAGAFLFMIEPRFLVPFSCGLIVLGAWMCLYYRTQLVAPEPEAAPADGIMVPVSNLLVYLLGPLVLTQPAWVSITIAVLLVMLLRARERLHSLARKIDGPEIITLAQFLVLTGIVLPLLPRTPVVSFTSLTPFQVWIAVVVVCSISYASYLLQRYVSPAGSVFFASLLGGMYSSTATTVVLSRRLRTATNEIGQLRSGVVLATAVMYIRIGIIIAIFNVPLAISLAPSLVILSLIAGVGSLALLKLHRASERDGTTEAIKPRNPLELWTAVIFAVVFVVISVLTVWIKQHFGSLGIYGLATVVGVTDIDPFVLSLANSNGQQGLTQPMIGTAILIGASSNNVLKAVYAVALGGWRSGRLPFLALVLCAAAGIGIAFLQ